MDTVRDRRLAIARGDAARALTENPVLLRAWDAIEADLVRQILACPPTNHATEHELCNLLRANRRAQEALLGWVGQGDAVEARSDRAAVLGARTV